MKFVLMGGTLRNGNRGVNALTRGTIEAFARLFDISSFYVLRIFRGFDYKESLNVNGRELVIEEVTCSAYKLIILTFMCLMRNIIFRSFIDKYLGKDNFLKPIYEAEIVFDISEGDSFSDIYGKKRFIIHSFNKLIVLLLGKKLILMPQTIGPFSNPVIRCVARYIMQKADYVLTRDDLSYKCCCDLNIDRSKVFVVPDMAFFMNPAKNVDIDSILGKNVRNQDGMVVGLNVSGLLYNGGYTKNNMFNLKTDYKSLVNQIIDELICNYNASVLLVPHVITYGREIVEDDLTVCRVIFEELKNIYPGKIFYINKPYKENELKQIIGKCDFFIGARMHACIGAISMGVPTVPIAYSRKFVGVWKMFGLDCYVSDSRHQNVREIISIIEKALSDREVIKLKLQNEMQVVREKITSIICKIGINSNSLKDKNSA